MSAQSSSDEMPGSAQSKQTSETWKDFCENSTLHGLRNVFASERRFQRIIWLVLLLGATGYLSYSIVNSIDRFFQYPSIIDLIENRKHSIPFPAITICPLNYLDNYKVHALDGNTNFTSYKLNISACAATADIRGGAPCGHALVCAFMDHPIFVTQRLPNCTDEYKQQISQALNKANITFDKMEFLRTFSETWNEVILYCIFGSVYRQCLQPRHYKLVPPYNKGGICYTFNDDTFQDLPIESETSGSMGAVSILLSHRSERSFYPMFAEGFRVYIHGQKAGLGVTEILAPPGKITSISMERNRIIKLDKSKGGNCEQKTLAGFKQYNQDDCLTECYSNATKEACGCREALPGEYNDSVTCYSVHTSCIANMSGNFRWVDCPCPHSCDETVYKTSVSYGSLPNSFVPGISQMYPFPDYTPEKYASISVYFSTHRDVVYRQKQAFGPTSLLGEIGGNMGLLLGCSLMTVVEFIFLLVSLIASFFKPKGQVRDTAQQAWN